VRVPEPGINLHLIYARSENARRVVAGLSAATPAVPEIWAQLDTALGDVPALGAIVARLSAALAATRLDRANLIAAMRATLAANAEGEQEPLFYLRDELAELGRMRNGPDRTPAVPVRTWRRA
jgi:hypothetical protein